MKCLYSTNARERYWKKRRVQRRSSRSEATYRDQKRLICEAARLVSICSATQPALAPQHFYTQNDRI
jgi:hypothetical protein